MSDETAVVVAPPAQKVTLTRYEAQRENWKYLLGLAKGVFQSGLAPDSVKSAEQAAVVMLTGQEMGIAPMTALRTISVVKGKATMAAELMIGIVRQRKAGQFVVKQDEGWCEMTGTRTDNGDVLTVKWDRERAERAGLYKNVVWKSYETEMLRHACERELCRALFSDVLAQVYTPDEIEAAGAVEGTVADDEPSRTDAVREVVGLAPAEPEPGPETPVAPDAPITDDEIPGLHEGAEG